MKEIGSITACVIDHGLNLPLAVQLAPHYDRTLYCNAAWIDAFPKLNKGIVGEGWGGVEVIDDYWDKKDEIDLFIFPDLYHAGEQIELISQGKPVWGSRHGDKTEIYRKRFMSQVEQLGLDVAPYTEARGLLALKKLLFRKEDCYIKISKWRGTMETTHWRNWEEDEGLLDHLACMLGPCKEMINFLVFDAVDTDIEVGCDTYCIDGQFPDTMVEGYEAKDKGYFGAVKPASEMPDAITRTNEAFQRELLSAGYRNFISSEIRIKDDKAYFLDPTRRMPCPASGSQLRLIGNLPEVIWAGANGELVQPQMTAKFSAEAMMNVKCKKGCWMVVDFPEELMDSIHCGQCCLIDGRVCSPPDDNNENEIGWLVNTGDTPKECIDGLLEKAQQLPDGVHACTDSLIEILKNLETAEEEGMPITGQELPAPAEIIEA